MVKAPEGVSRGHANSSVSSMGMVLKLHSETSEIQRQLWDSLLYASPGGHSYLVKYRIK